MDQKIYPIEHLYQLAVQALVFHSTNQKNASQVAEALLAAEADGLKSHGLARLSSYCAQSASGKVDGRVYPELHRVASGAVTVDAHDGFAYPALDLAVRQLCKLTPETGVAVASISGSHHCGAAGYHVEKLAQKGLVGILFSNTPEAIAPWGGCKGVFGTNPIAFAAPRKDKDPLVIDLSLSKVARGKIMVAKKEKQPIPEGWALDSEGKPTTDPTAALSGTMVPMGDAKGAALAFMVEVMAAALTASNFGFEASSFFEAKGESSGVGQLLIAFAPNPLSGNGYYLRIEGLIETVLGQENTRLPGERRLRMRQKAYQEGVPLAESQYDELQKLAFGSYF